MPPGIRATVEFTDPAVCPIADLSADGETVVGSVSANVCPTDCTESVTEFSTVSGAPPETDLPPTVTPVFSHGSIHRYRLTHGDGVNCPCECLGRFGCPVERYTARDGTLTLVFHAADFEQLQAVVAALRERFPAVDIKRFVRSPDGEPPADSVFVDRGKLTPRQLEVVQTAYEMGYFERPRAANATDVAAALDIDPTTFSEHLATAQRKLLEDLL